MQNLNKSDLSVKITVSDQLSALLNQIAVKVKTEGDLEACKADFQVVADLFSRATYKSPPVLEQPMIRLKADVEDVQTDQERDYVATEELKTEIFDAFTNNTGLQETEKVDFQQPRTSQPSLNFILELKQKMEERARIIET